MLTPRLQVDPTRTNSPCFGLRSTFTVGLLDLVTFDLAHEWVGGCDREPHGLRLGAGFDFATLLYHAATDTAWTRQ
jgi:hypothetical protein